MVRDNDRGELVFLIKALMAWLITAFALVLIFSTIISNTSFDSSYIAYTSSLVSFISAIFAGLRASKYVKNSSIYIGLFTSVFLIVVLLTTGFVVQGQSISPSGILSVVSFTFAGVMLGACLLPAICYGNRKNNRAKARRRLHS